MTCTRRLLAAVILAVAALVSAGCNEYGGIGMAPTGGGARWGSGAAGPDVFVGGGPVLY